MKISHNKAEENTSKFLYAFDNILIHDNNKESVISSLHG